MAKNDNLKDFLADLANAIRDKKGTTEKINPQDFSEEIASIQTSGGSDIPDYYSEEGVLEYKDAVRFLDYDGTILYIYTIEEAKELKELPPLPSHEGLICQGWNYTLEDIREQDLFCEIGATYITDDGATRCHIIISDSTDRAFTIYVGSNCEVNWGDGFIETYQSGAMRTHTYQSIGEYVVSVKNVAGGEAVISTSSYSFIKTTTWSDESGWDTKVKKIHLGKISSSSLNLGNFNELEILTFPSGILNITNRICSKKLKSIIFPRGLLGFPSIVRYSNYFNIKGFRISIPNTVTKINGGQEVCGTERVIYPSSVVTLSSYEGDCATDVVSHVNKSSSNGLCRLSLAKSGIVGSSVSAGGSAVKVVSKESPKMQDSTSYASIIPAQIRNGKIIKTKDIIIPDGVEQIPSNAFNRINANSFTFPDSLTSIDSGAFSFCLAQLYDFSMAKSIPIMGSSSFSSFFDFRIVVPVELYYDWKSATNWSLFARQIHYDYVPMECVKLELNAPNISGREEFTTIEYIATTNGVRKNGERVENILIFGSTISEVFGINPSYEDSIERQISFTYLGFTATTTITQTPFYTLCMKCKYDVTSNSQSTSILSRTTGLSSMSIDGGEDIPVSTSYQFDTIGEHEVIFKPTNDNPPTNLYRMFYGITALNEVDCSLLDMSAANSSNTDNGTAYMFYQCSGLKKIILPSTIKYMGRYMFRYCSNVESLTILARKAPTPYSYQTFGYSSSDFIGYNNKDNGTNKFYVPKGASGYNVSPWTDKLLSTSYCGFTLEEIDEQ